MLMADAGARDIARKLVQIERQLQSLFASHGTIFLILCVKRRLRRHEKILTRVKLERIIFCIDMVILVECAWHSAVETALLPTLSRLPACLLRRFQKTVWPIAGASGCNRVTRERAARSRRASRNRRESA